MREWREIRADADRRLEQIGAPASVARDYERYVARRAARTRTFDEVIAATEARDDRAVHAAAAHADHAIAIQNASVRALGLSDRCGG